MNLGQTLLRIVGYLLRLEDAENIESFEFSFAEPWAHSGPFWVFFGCLAMVALATIFYWKYQPRGRTPAGIALSIARSILLVLLLLALANPTATINYAHRPRPTLWVVFDGTDSMGIQDDYSAADTQKLRTAVGMTESTSASTLHPTRQEYVQALLAKPENNVLKRLSEKFKLQAYLFQRPGGVDTLAVDKSAANAASTPATALAFQPVDDVQPRRYVALSGGALGMAALLAFLALWLANGKPIAPWLLGGMALVGFGAAIAAIATADLSHPEDFFFPPNENSIDPAALAKQLTTDGKVTAIGDALKDLSLRRVTSDLAGVVVFSDFANNHGIEPVGSDVAPARKLAVPIYTVGIGPAEAVDVAVDLTAPPTMKKGERSTVGVIVHSIGLDGRRVNVKVTARRRDMGAVASDVVIVGERNVQLGQHDAIENFDFTPKESGRFVFTAEIEKLSEEQADQNNRSERDVRIRDDFLRLMFVEYEPTWEWRFIKEVFHRDPLVGQQGFRTFLRSADPRVRQTNELFLPTLTPKRSDFFQTDVIFIGDMPQGSLSPRFCELTKEFVKDFGGGLVVIAGPRFGPGVLAETPLADMLPVVLDPNGRIRDQQEFPIQLTPVAMQYEFMRLGGGTDSLSVQSEQAKAWSNLGRLPWYQPVANKQSEAYVLVEHPTDTCNDEKTKQPLVAIRRFGKGEVVYLGFDETWRLRKRFGELYYKQFWGQMIHRLGLSHAIGDQKRFVVRTDQQQYKEDDTVTLTVEAYDENYEPLTEDKIPNHKLSAELILPAAKGKSADRQSYFVTQVREGVYEARIPVHVAGEHRLEVRDPVKNDTAEVQFQVAALSAERRSAVRNANLEHEIATVSGGKMYSLETVSNLPDDLKLQHKIVRSSLVRPLWNNWLTFGVIVTLMLGEWFTRKLMNLP